ncbi:MAG: hypothetical protein KBA33_08335 [Cloacibacterium sp.]|nr:hypothetical protein [Cloacibacterium sp.]
MAVSKQNIGRKRNLLHRYKLVMEEFNKHDCRIIPITVIHREYIYPKFGISRDTLYSILNTDLDEEKAKLDTEISKTYGASLFD